MRNLYKRLGISSSSSTEEIKAAIRRCDDSSVREDASTVLLDDRRRSAYNQLNAVLSDVGLLRARLGLGHASNWQGPVASEYAQTNDLSQTMLEELTKKLEAIKRTDSSGSISDSIGRSIGPYFMTILVIGFLGIIIGFFEKDASPPPKSTSYSIKDSSFKTEFNQKALPLPLNGTTRLHVSLEQEAPFQITNRSISLCKIQISLKFSE